MQNIIESLKNKNVEEFLRSVSSLLPPSDDISISLIKLGPHEYVLDRKGVSLVSTSLDEYLPYLSSNEKRIDYTQIPKAVKDRILQDYKNILKQLYDILSAFSRREKDYAQIVQQLGELLNENK
ncbi:hypothetical protein DFR86_05155 [Acidianus sulfidivorans JP7]|uniref:Uncharacterized protein n=1 Tax=Acidianus sulfidivorans JP7 TaxID=619593 RepID=A0A2U9ILW4_9CREN|nr:hypothetical protein [Acidianus sulfidivorans]AWR97007.1 hypothetical protein DFR86_05155 [Acidianus sulfidivorans JP7]